MQLQNYFFQNLYNTLPQQVPIYKYKTKSKKRWTFSMGKQV